MKFSKRILLIILIIMNFYCFYKLNTNKFNINYLFKPSCSIEKIKDIELCYKTNRNVIVKTDHIYETGYHYLDNKYVFVDIEISGKTLIGLIKKENINNKSLYGYLEITDNVLFKEIVKNIKKDYEKKLEIENIDEAFIPVELNSYQYKNSNIVNIVLVIIFLITISSILFISIKIIKEEKYEK